MSKFVEYRCMYGHLFVDDLLTPSKIKLGSRILLKDHRHPEHPITEFEVVAIKGKQLMVEDVEEGEAASVFVKPPSPVNVRIPNEGEKIGRREVSGTVYLAVREVRRRIMGSREEARYEAELRDLIGDAYMTVGRVARSTKEDAKAAARSLATKRGWQLDETKRLGWATRDASYERAFTEAAPNVTKPAKPRKDGERVVIPVIAIEFCEGGNTLWIHGPEGGTILRLKTLDGSITSKRCQNGGVSHGDAILKGDLEICIASRDKERLP